MDKDKFCLVIGHGRSGTNLCGGLIDSNPEINFGYEINNRDSNISVKPFPEKYNGNKVVIFPTYRVEFFLNCLLEKKCIVNSFHKKLFVVFTRRYAIDTMVSRFRRVRDKGQYPSHEQVFREWMAVEQKIKEIKSYVDDYFEFDFDKALVSDSHVEEMFFYLGLEYNHGYYDDYRGTMNYTYAIGVGKHNVLMGKEGKFEEDRIIFKELWREYESRL